MADPHVSVIIPSWNGAELLPRVLDSLREQTFRDFETIVVDNGSEDDSVPLLRRDDPGVRIVELATNHGFAGAVNAGMAVARGEVVALLNNDAVADPAWLEALVRGLREHPEVGSCASRMLDLDDPHRIDSAGDQLGIFPSNYGRGQSDGVHFRRPVYVLSACAGAAAYRRTMLDEVGVFDERYFAYMEDIDLGIRAQFRGHDCLYVPDAVVYHEGSLTGNRMPERKFFLLMRNSLLVFFQYMPPVRRAVWAPVVLTRVVLNARRAGLPTAVARRAITAALGDWRRIAARRREVRRQGTLSWSQFRRRLAQPLAHSTFSAPVLADSGASRRPVPSPAPVGASSVASERPGVRHDRVPVDVVIVNWNGGRYLERALHALRASTVETRVILVDNASRDDSLEVAARFPEVETVPLESNRGYAGGANAGLTRGRAPFALVMNPDVLLEPDYLEILQARLLSAPRVGAAQGKLFRMAAEDFLQGTPPERRVLDSTGHVVRRNRSVVDRGQGEPDDPRYAIECPVFSATGAALFLRRAMLGTLDDAGHYFDPTFFAYKEEIDLCWRARLRGWEVLYVPAAVAHHVRNLPGDDRSAWHRLPLSARRHSWKNQYLMMLKNDRVRDLLASLPRVGARELARLGFALVRDPRLLPVYPELVRHLPRAMHQRHRSLRAARELGVDLSHWFGRDPVQPRSSARSSRQPQAVASRTVTDG